ncbi:MAG: hypothetical protein M3405_01105 [Acidobacteriota bacterium]|nr:hypothetical protein [Acidobacteriota bacterium]
MSNWKSKHQNIFERVDDWSDDVRHRLRKFDDYDSLLITPYIGFGNSDKIFLRGRVLEDKGFRDSNESDSHWRNLKNMYHHFETDEVSNARVKAFFQNVESEVRN